MKNIEEIIRSRLNRAARFSRPFKNFYDSYQQYTNVAQLIISGPVSLDVKDLLERSTVISMVTAIEVYYRDTLDLIFRYCEPQYFEPHLKQFLSEKFDIDDLVQVYRNKIHPLELVVSSQSFQNRQRIDKVFSKFLGSKGLWDHVLSLRIRLKDRPESESIWSQDDLIALDRLFHLRHQLVHDPMQSSFLNEGVLRDIEDSAGLILASDIILSKAIEVHRDPNL